MQNDDVEMNYTRNWTDNSELWGEKKKLIIENIKRNRRKSV